MKKITEAPSRRKGLNCFIILALCSKLACANATGLEKQPDNASLNIHEPQSLNLSTLFKPATFLDTILGANTATYTFISNGGVTDTINYAQLSLCSSDCSVCHAPIQTITASPSSPITINGFGIPSYSINKNALTAYLNTYGGFTTAGTYYISLYVQSATQQCNSNNSYCSANTDSTNAQKLCMAATYSGLAVTNITQIDNGTAILNTSTNQFVYVVDVGLNKVYHCTIPSTGALQCTVTTNQGVANPWSIAITTVNGTPYAYVLQFSGSSDNIYYCGINTDGDLGNTPVQACSSVGTNLFNSTGGSPYQIAFTTLPNTQSQYAYVASGADVYYCTINNNGTFNTCTLASNIPLGFGNDIEGIAIATSPSGVQYAYLADQNNGVFQCTIDSSSGDFSTCSLTTDGQPANDASMQAITFSKVNGTQYAYMGNFAGNTYSCAFNASTGALGSCTKQPSTQPTWTPFGITTAITNGGAPFVYVASQGFSKTVNSMAINPDGTLSSTVSPTGGVTWNSPNAFASAYIPAP